MTDDEAEADIICCEYLLLSVMQKKKVSIPFLICRNTKTKAAAKH